jgi:hypothetical protein
MDEFDIIDLVYNHVAAADTGMTVYQRRSVSGETENHITVSGMEYHEFDWNNVLPVNVNIFIKHFSGSGMADEELMKETVRKVRAELKKIRPEKGKYQSIELSGSVPFPNAKEGFDCTNIKVIINVEKNIEDYG